MRDEDDKASGVFCSILGFIGVIPCACICMFFSLAISFLFSACVLGPGLVYTGADFFMLGSLTQGYVDCECDGYNILEQDKTRG